MSRRIRVTALIVAAAVLAVALFGAVTVALAEPSTDKPILNTLGASKDSYWTDIGGGVFAMAVTVEGRKYIVFRYITMYGAGLSACEID